MTTPDDDVSNNQRKGGDFKGKSEAGTQMLWKQPLK